MIRFERGADPEFAYRGRVAVDVSEMVSIYEKKGEQKSIETFQNFESSSQHRWENLSKNVKKNRWSWFSHRFLRSQLTDSNH